MSVLGAVSTYKDFKKQFYKQYHLPYQHNKSKQEILQPMVPVLQVSEVK